MNPVEALVRGVAGFTSVLSAAAEGWWRNMMNSVLVLLRGGEKPVQEI